mgnify:CR=1 FL=1
MQPWKMFIRSVSVVTLLTAGGFAAGILLTLPVFWRNGGGAFWSRTHGRPPNPRVPSRTAWSSQRRTPR